MQVSSHQFGNPRWKSQGIRPGGLVCWEFIVGLLGTYRNLCLARHRQKKGCTWHLHARFEPNGLHGRLTTPWNLHGGQEGCLNKATRSRPKWENPSPTVEGDGLALPEPSNHLAGSSDTQRVTLDLPLASFLHFPSP